MTTCEKKDYLISFKKSAKQKNTHKKRQHSCFQNSNFHEESSIMNALKNKRIPPG